MLSRAFTCANTDKQGRLMPRATGWQRAFFVCPFALASFPQAPTGKGDEFESAAQLDDAQVLLVLAIFE